MLDIRAPFSADYWRDHLLTVVYVGAGLLFFFIFLAADFPYGEALSSMAAPFGLSLTYKDRQSSLPFGAELDGVTLTNLLAPGSPPLLENTTLTLTPGLVSLLFARPSINAKAELYGGFVTLGLSRAHGAIRVSVETSNLDLGRYNALMKMGVNLRGFVSGNGAGSIPEVDPVLGNGQLHIAVKRCTLRVARGLPMLKLGDLDGAAHLAHGMLQIDSLTAHGGDFEVNATGTLKLAPDLSDSLLDLQLKLVPTAAARTRLAFLLQMLPHPPGPEPYLIRGPITAPAIS
jgi:type II secretion system protein N